MDFIWRDGQFGRMRNWYIAYRHAQLIRLLSIVLVFGGLWPTLCRLGIAGSRFATRIGRDTRLPRGRTI
jgi:hypothetical protein